MRLASLSTLLEVYEGPVTIEYWSDDSESDNYDPWVAADQADTVATKSNIGISRAKDLTLIALDDEQCVIGAVWSYWHEDSDEQAWIFDFDVAVDPQCRSPQTKVGLRLIDAALQEFEDTRGMYDGDNTMVNVHVVNLKLANVLERKYGFEVESEYRDSGMVRSKRMTYYGAT